MNVFLYQDYVFHVGGLQGQSTLHKNELSHSITRQTFCSQYATLSAHAYYKIPSSLVHLILYLAVLGVMDAHVHNKSHVRYCHLSLSADLVKAV